MPSWEIAFIDAHHLSWVSRYCKIIRLPPCETQPTSHQCETKHKHFWAKAKSIQFIQAPNNPSFPFIVVKSQFLVLSTSAPNPWGKKTLPLLLIYLPCCQGYSGHSDLEWRSLEKLWVSTLVSRRNSSWNDMSLDFRSVGMDLIEGIWFKGFDLILIRMLLENDERNQLDQQLSPKWDSTKLIITHQRNQFVDC